MPFTAAISRTLARPSLLSMMVQLMSSPSGLIGHTSAFALYSASDMPQNAGAEADAVRTRAALRLEAHGRDGLLHLVGALGFGSIRPLTPRLSCVAMFGVDRRLVELRGLDDERMGQAQRRLADGAGGLHALHEIGEGWQRALEPAFHAAVEHEIGVLIGHGLGRKLGGCLLRWRRCGGAGCVRRRSGGPGLGTSAAAWRSGPAVAGRVAGRRPASSAPAGR